MAGGFEDQGISGGYMLTVETPKGTITIDDSERTKCEVWSRVMGYYRPVSEYNIGKISEHNERTFFSENQAVNHL